MVNFVGIACVGWFLVNGYVYETFGISKHFPVKIQQILIRAKPNGKPLTAKCFIYDVTGRRSFSSLVIPSKFLVLSHLQLFFRFQLLSPKQTRYKMVQLSGNDFYKVRFLSCQYETNRFCL